MKFKLLSLLIVLALATPAAAQTTMTLRGMTSVTSGQTTGTSVMLINVGSVATPSDRIIGMSELSKVVLGNSTAGLNLVITGSTIATLSNMTGNNITLTGKVTTGSLTLTNFTSGILISGNTGQVDFTTDLSAYAATSLTFGGSGLALSGTKGALTLTNTGVTSLTFGGSGLSLSGTNGALTFTNTGVTSLTIGTADLFSMTGTIGNLSLAQTLTASPTMASLTLAAAAGGVLTSKETTLSSTFSLFATQSGTNAPRVMLRIGQTTGDTFPGFYVAPSAMTGAGKMCFIQVASNISPSASGARNLNFGITTSRAIIAPSTRDGSATNTTPLVLSADLGNAISNLGTGLILDASNLNVQAITIGADTAQTAAQLGVVSRTNSIVTLSLSALASQTASILNIANSSNTSKVYVDSSFNLITQSVGINTGTTPNSTLQVGGSMALKLAETATNYTLTSTDGTIVSTTSGAITLTLPTATSITGRIYDIIGSGGGTVTLTSGSTITGATQISTTGKLRATSNGTLWYVY